MMSTPIVSAAAGEFAAIIPASSKQAHATQPKALSCILCAQRKVKCDKTIPCSNCVRAGATCVATVPKKPERRKRKGQATEELLMTRLRRYEKLLLKHGVRKEELDGQSEALTVNELGSLSLSSYSAVQEERQQSRTNVGKDHQVWTSLSDEILESSSDEEFAESDTHEPLADEGLLFDDPISIIPLTSLHPQPIQIFQLWQAFVDNVDPLLKLFHAPTVQQRIIQASGNLEDISKPTQALMFAIYAIALTSLTDAECESMMGDRKEKLLSKYHGAAQQALKVANLLRTSDMVVLQAFVLFLHSVRYSYDIQALCILTGTASRLAQRLGLHQEVKLAKRSIFDAEMGRRLWWQIGLLDSRTSELAGIVTLTDPRVWDARIPLNLNDSSLFPDMKELPLEHDGVTEMAFCSMRYQVGQYLKQSPVLSGSWKFLRRHDVPLAEKEAVLRDLEDITQRHTLQYLDLAIPLHTLINGVAHSVTDRFWLMCLHPRQRPDRGANMEQSEKDKLFALCLKIINRDNWTHTENRLQRYSWHVKAQFQSDAFIYLLNEIRCQPTGSNADNGWAEVLEVFEHHPDMLTNTKVPLYGATASLVLKAWNAREAAFAEMNQVPPEGASPHAILVLRSKRVKSTSRTPNAMPMSFPPEVDYRSPNDFTNQMSYNPTFPVAESDGIMSIGETSIDWSYWNDLMQNNGMEMQDANAQYQS